MPYGVQIFGCLPEFRRDPEGFFDRLAAMGYRQVEPCVVLGREGDFPPDLWRRLWKPEEVPALERSMARRGLGLSSCHVFSKDLLAAGEDMLALAGETSLDTFVVNVPAWAVGERYIEFSALCRALGEKLRARGVSLWVHNGGPEIAARVERQGRQVTVLEAILEEAGQALGAQVDTGWVLAGGIDPAQFLQRLGDRVKSLHFKDMAPGFEKLSGASRFAVLGRGVTDIPGVLRAAPESVESVLVDQDLSQGDFFQDLEDSLEALEAAKRGLGK